MCDSCRFKPVYRKVQQERINLQRGGAQREIINLLTCWCRNAGSKTGMSGKHQWYVAVASEIGAKCPQTDFQYLKRNAPDWDTSGPQVLYLSPFDNNHVAQEGVGTYCCLDLPKGYNQECMRGDMSPAVMYSSQYAASKVLQRYGMLMTPAMGTLLQVSSLDVLCVCNDWFCAGRCIEMAKCSVMKKTAIGM